VSVVSRFLLTTSNSLVLVNGLGGGHSWIFAVISFPISSLPNHNEELFLAIVSEQAKE
jgi:hypothetical protein